MARIIKRKKDTSILSKLAIFMMTTSLISTLFVSLFILPLNASLRIEIQNMQAESASLKEQNQKLAIEIQTLQNKDRIYTIAEDAGLQQIQDNVISVSRGD